MSKEEAREIQRKLKWINRNGCMISVWSDTNKEGEPSVYAMVDSVFCTGVKDGLPELLWLSVGYDGGGMSAVHRIETAEIVYTDEVESEEGLQWVDAVLVDSKGYKFNIDMIFKQYEPDKHAAWEKWQKYKAGNPERFKRAEMNILDGTPDIGYILS